jgi:hypothetical protein
MLQRKFAGCMFLLAASAISWAQSAVPSQPQQGNSATPTSKSAPASGALPQQQPAWRPGQPLAPKPAPPRPQSNSVEPTTGASISWPGAGNQAHVVVPQSAATNPAMARPVNASLPSNATRPAVIGGMPIALPLMGSSGRAGVEYHAGLLSVVAENAELGKLMRLVGSRTGAQIDVSPDVATELVMAHLGPASPNEVLTALLDSSHLTYIMIGEDKVTKVVVRRRYGSAPPPAVARHRNLGFPEPAAEAQPTEPEQVAESGQIRPAGEMAPPAIPSRSPLMRSGSSQPASPGQADNGGNPIENVDVRGQVGGTEAPEQPEANPPQQ